MLEPLFFMMYINGICNVTRLLKFVLFTDDTNIFCSGNDALDLSNTWCMELDKLNTWFVINELSLNVIKTNYLFGNKK